MRPRPSISWYFYNLFRLVAVVFMVWALAAQFVALASDLGELSRAKASPSSPSSRASSISTPTRAATRSIAITTVVQPTGLITNSLPPLASRSTAVTVAQLGPEAITTTPPIIRPISTTAASIVDGPLVVARPGERSLIRRAEGDKDVPTSGVYGLSSVPTSAGGPMFSSVSRMIMATLLGFLLLVQLGIPEMWSYNNVPAFGPQSTALWLGVAQVIIAVEGLRVYSVPLVWAAHAGLLVIGMINSHLALILILLARRRKLPKSPPPPLYFSRTTRLLFFRPLPECYIQLLSKEEQAQIEAVHSEMAYSSNPEDGLVLDSGPWRMKNRHVPPLPPKDEGMTDIRQGGYPTCARGGLTATGTQIPASTLDITPDGRTRGLIARPVGDRRSLETTGDAYSGVADDPRAPSRTDTVDERKGSNSSIGSGKSKRKPAPLGLSPVGDHSHLERRQFGRQRSITALREKIHQRMERKASLEGDASGPGLIGDQKAVPTITTTMPSAGLSALHMGPTRSSTVDTANTFGRPPTMLRSIPKRGNTISQCTAPSRSHVPERASSQSQATTGRHPIPVPGPVSRSPTNKSIAESTASSSLPWTKPSTEGTTTESVSVVKPAHADQPSRRRTATLPPVRSNTHIQGQSSMKEDAVSTEMKHVSRTSLQIPAAATVTRTPSGSKLQKPRKADTKSPSPRSTSPIRSDIPSKPNEDAVSGSKPSRNASVRGGLKPESTLEAGGRSPNTLKKRPSPSPSPIPISPSSPISPPPRPQSADTISVIQSSLRSSLAPLNRQASVRSTRSARTAMGVRFDLEKRYSTSSSETDTDCAERESLLSPDTNHSTSRSAGFRIPGTKWHVPFPGTPRTKSKGNRPISEATSASTSSPAFEDYGNLRSGLELEMADLEDEIEAARPESFASQSTISSMREKSAKTSDQREYEIEKKGVVGERAGLPKRAASIAIETKPVSRKEAPVLGGQYIDGGHEGNWKKGHVRRASSVSIDPRQSGGHR